MVAIDAHGCRAPMTLAPAGVRALRWSTAAASTQSYRDAGAGSAIQCEAATIIILNAADPAHSAPPPASYNKHQLHHMGMGAGRLGHAQRKTQGAGHV